MFWLCAVIFLGKSAPRTRQNGLLALLLSVALFRRSLDERSADGPAPIVTYADHVAAMLGRTHLDGRDGTLLVTYSSPSHNRTATTVVRNTSASSSPGSDRVKAIRGSPNWRPMEASFVHRSGNRGTNFVRRSGHEADDVFGSPGHPEATQPSGEGRSSLSEVIFPPH